MKKQKKQAANEKKTGWLNKHGNNMEEPFVSYAEIEAEKMNKDYFNKKGK